MTAPKSVQVDDGAIEQVIGRFNSAALLQPPVLLEITPTAVPESATLAKVIGANNDTLADWTGGHNDSMRLLAGFWRGFHDQQQTLDHETSRTLNDHLDRIYADVPSKPAQ